MSLLHDQKQATDTAPQMEVVDDGPKAWVVLAEWYGEMRVVFRGDIFECCHWRAEQEGN